MEFKLGHPISPNDLENGGVGGGGGEERERERDAVNCLGLDPSQFKRPERNRLSLEGERDAASIGQGFFPGPARKDASFFDESNGD